MTGRNSGNFIRNLIVGKDRHIDSYSEYKRVMVSGKLALVYMLLCVGYIMCDIPMGHVSNVPVLVATIVLLWISLWYHRMGDHKTANYCQLNTAKAAIAFTRKKMKAPEFDDSLAVIR